MAQMIRKQIYIEPIQEAKLKRQAKIMGITEAEVVRRAIDQQTVLSTSGRRDMSAWEREKSFIVERMKERKHSGGRKFNREEIYEE
jgi:hypothetical protein